MLTNSGINSKLSVMSFGLIIVVEEEVELLSETASILAKESFEGFFEKKAKCHLTSSLAG